MDITLKNLTKSFDGAVVLDRFNTVVKEKQFNCILGESGIGKTTLINIIMGLIIQDHGEISGLEGKRISAVFQEDRLCEDFNAITNIKLVARKDTMEQEIIEVLENLGLGDSLNKKVSLFSGGMRRRLAIARALVAESDIVIMDEPFKGLDKELYINTINYIKEKLEGKTVIVITHREEESSILEANNIYM